MILKNKFKIIAIIISIFILLFANYSYGYSEGLFTASSVLAPKTDLETGDYSSNFGFHLKADIMNNSGFSLGAGYTWFAPSRWIDLRTLYWTSEHMTGFYLGVEGHAQYYPCFGAGGGANFGYALPLTEYINLTTDAEIGYGSQKFWEAAYNHIYYSLGIGLSYSFM